MTPTKLLLIVLQLTGGKALIENQPEGKLSELDPLENYEDINHIWKIADQPMYSPGHPTEYHGSFWSTHVSHQDTLTEIHLPPLFNDAGNPPALLHASELAHSVHNSDSPDHSEPAMTEFHDNHHQSLHLSLEQSSRPLVGNLNDSPHQVEREPQWLPVRSGENSGFAPADHETWPHTPNGNWPTMPLFSPESPLAHSHQNAHDCSPESTHSLHGQSHDSHQGYPNHLLPQVQPLPTTVNLGAISQPPSDDHPTLSHASDTPLKKKGKRKAAKPGEINAFSSKTKPLKAMKCYPELSPSPSPQGKSHDYPQANRNNLSPQLCQGSMQVRSTYDDLKSLHEKSIENDEETAPFDVWNIPLLPYYIAAFDNFPLSNAPGENAWLKNVQFLDKARQALSESSFKITGEHDEKSLSHFLGVDTSKTSLKKILLHSAYDFMRRLALKNLAFLTLIHDKIDHQLVEETKKTLNWLYQIYPPTNDLGILQPSKSANPVHSAIRKIVRECLQPGNTIQSDVLIRHSQDAQSSNRPVAEREAKKVQAMIIILGSYYKSKNGTKWKTFFSEDIDFVKFHLKLALIRINRNLSKSMQSQRRILNGLNLLPWEASTSKLTLRSLPALFNNARQLSQMIKQRVEPEGNDKEKWIQLQRFESSESDNSALETNNPTRSRA